MARTIAGFSRLVFVLVFIFVSVAIVRSQNVSHTIIAYLSVIYVDVFRRLVNIQRSALAFTYHSMLDVGVPYIIAGTILFLPNNVSNNVVQLHTPKNV